MNNCNFTGRITKDLELKQTPGGTKVIDFSLAVPRRDKDKNTDFIPCKAWAKTAETMAAYLKKGSYIELSGRLESRTYENSDGKKVYVYEVVVSTFGFLESKGEQQSSQATPTPATPPTPPPVEPITNFNISEEDESRLPFDI